MSSTKLATEKQVRDVVDTFSELYNHQGKQLQNLSSDVIDAVHPLSPAPTKAGKYVVLEPGVFNNFKDSEGLPISFTEADTTSGFAYIIFNRISCEKLIVPIEAIGKVEDGDVKPVSGGEVFKSNTKLESDIKIKSVFTKSGYLAFSSGLFYEDNVRKTTPLLPLSANTVLSIHTTIPNIDEINIATLVLYEDDGKTIIDKFKTNELLEINNTDYSAAYFRACGDIRFGFSLNYNVLDEITTSYNEGKQNNLLDKLPKNNTYQNSMWTQAASNNFSSIDKGNYGGTATEYLIKNKSTNGVMHLAFKFRINEDVNIGDEVNKSFVRFNAGEEFLDFYLKTKNTRQFDGGEQDNSPVNTRSPIPYYQSRFGVRSSINKNLLNIEMNERGLKYQQGSSSVNLESTKPIVGNDVFSIKITSCNESGNILRDTTSSVSQAAYEKWKNAYVEINDTSFIVKNEYLNFERIYSLVTYKLVRNLFENIYRDLNNLIVDNVKFEITGIDVTPWNDLLTKDLLKHKFYLATEYCRLDGIRTFYDSFPIHIPMAIDDSWHTFEFVVVTNKDEMYYCIDGQYMNITYSNPQMFVTGIKSFIKNTKDISIGRDLNIQVRDLVYEFDEYSEVYTSRVTGDYNTVLFSSKMHPLVWNFFGHDLYHSDYSGGAYDLYTKLESAGGKIPNNLFYTDRNGDGTPNVKRVGIYQPSWQFESGLAFMKKTGFVFITHKQYVDYVKTGVAPHHRCCVVGFDDMPTYIYSNPKLKRIFNKYGCKPYFALELGWYVDKHAPTKSYNALEWINVNLDTNERRLKLQKTLLALQNDDWGIELHGSKEGYIFRGSTYFEMLDEIDETIEIANYLGIETSSWCIAGNYQTPNMVKLFEHRGIEVATSTVLSTTSKAFPDTYQPRTLMPSSYARQRMYFPLDI